MKRFLIEIFIIIVLWFGHSITHNISYTVGFWYTATIMVFAAKGVVMAYNDYKRIAKGEH